MNRKYGFKENNGKFYSAGSPKTTLLAILIDLCL